MSDNTVSSRIKHATKTSSTWSTNNPVLLEGEIGVDSTNHILKVGDGTTAWNSLKAWTLPDVTTTDNGKSLLVSSGVWAVDNLLPVLSSGTKFLRNASGTLSWQNVVTSITIKANSPLSIDSTSAITTSGTRTLSHATSGVTAGTYTSVTVDTYGHVTVGSSPTTLSGYGITDAKIDSGVITLGSNTITPLTSASTLDATKLSGTIPSGCYTNTKNTAGSTDTSSKIFLVGATEQSANPQTYSDDEVFATSGVLSVKQVSAKSGLHANTNNGSTSGGISLYGTEPNNYGIAMRSTGTGTGQMGKHGYVQGDWGIYFTNSGATNRGFIFRHAGSNVASVSGLGNAVFNGNVTVGGNSANTSGCRMEFNSTTKSLDFVFV